MDIKIFSAFHKPFFMKKDDIFEPIHAGAKDSKCDLGILRDDKGDNISSKNWLYAELSAYYWVWKNYKKKLDYIGFCHYRRYFIFNNSYDVDFRFPLLGENIIYKLSIFNKKEIQKIVENFDIILPIGYKTTSIKQQFINDYLSYGYGTKKEEAEYNFDSMIEAIKEIFPNKKDEIDKISKSNYIYLYNMFIMKEKIFKKYMDFMFTILFKIENKIILPKNAKQKKMLGFMGERLINFFIHLSDQDLKIKELGKLQFENYFEKKDIHYNKNLLKNKKIISYGYGEEGKKILQIIKRKGLKLEFIIDDFLKSDKSITFQEFIETYNNDNYVIVLGKEQNIYHDFSILKPYIVCLNCIEKNFIKE